jgi:fluoride ion exporter CrcB/FEX
LQDEVFTSSNDSSLTQLEEKPSASKGAGLFNTELCTISWLVLFAILGTLARLGVQALTTYPDAPFLSTVLWANLGGSLFLGFLLEDRRLFRYTVEIPVESGDHKGEIDKTKKTYPLYIGLATGFCGSFTSFSTFITDAFLALTNALPSPSPTSPYHTVAQNAIHSRNGGYSFLATTGILIVQPAVSLAALKTGAHMAIAAEPVLPGLSMRMLHRVLDPFSILLGWGAWLGAVLLCIWPPQHDWRYRATFSVAFAPPGALLRFYLSKHLNARIASFPLGTFIANISGTMIEGMCMDLQHSRTIVANVPGVDAATCAVLQGVMFGFCGCATTVSTWVAELNGLRRRHAWFYGLTSVAVALAFQVVIMGSMGWTVGFDQHCQVKAA